MGMAKFPTMDEFAKDVAEKVIDEYEYHGKTIREWIHLILNADAVPVVRCKDCKHNNMNGGDCNGIITMYHYEEVGEQVHSGFLIEGGKSP